MHKYRNIVRWVILLTAFAGGLYLLNSALFCAWVSGGPPNKYPKAWLQYSYIYFGYSGALISLGFLAFAALREKFNWKRSVAFYLCVPTIIYCLAAPKVREYILIDKCLDSGGRWDKQSFTCQSK